MHRQFIQQLADGQVDFDLGDEMIMEELGRVEGAGMVVGERTYELVVVPAMMENLCARTLELLAAYLERGGRVFALSIPTLVDGRPSEAVRELAERYAAQWQVFAEPDELIATLRRQMPPRVSLPAAERCRTACRCSAANWTPATSSSALPIRATSRLNAKSSSRVGDCSRSIPLRAARRPYTASPAMPGRSPCCIFLPRDMPSGSAAPKRLMQPRPPGRPSAKPKSPLARSGSNERNRTC